MLDVAVVGASDQRCDVRLFGELDALAMPRLADLLGDVNLTAGGALALDLSSVVFIDSAGIHALYRLADHVELCGGKLVLVDPPEHIRRVLDIVGFTAAPIESAIGRDV